MGKAVVILEKDQADDAGPIVDEISAMPGIDVTGWSKSFIDVVFEGDAWQALKNFVTKKHLSLSAEPEAELIEPIDPWKTL